MANAVSDLGAASVISKGPRRRQSAMDTSGFGIVQRMQDARQRLLRPIMQPWLVKMTTDFFQHYYMFFEEWKLSTHAT